MYLNLGLFTIGRPKSPGALSLETPSFDGIIKQHAARREYLAHLIQRGNDELKQIASHFEFRYNELKKQEESQVKDVTERLLGHQAEHDAVLTRETALKSLSSNIN